MNLNDFTFPICERPVAINNGQNDLTDWDNISTFLTSYYKAIVREDTNEVISIVKNTYQVVPNENLIKKLMHELVLIDARSQIDDSHSWSSDEKILFCPDRLGINASRSEKENSEQEERIFAYFFQGTSTYL